MWSYKGFILKTTMKARNDSRKKNWLRFYGKIFIKTIVAAFEKNRDEVEVMETD